MRTNQKERLVGVAMAMAALMAFFLPGCLDHYGRLKTNPAVTDIFKNQRELPGYHYYYCGREMLPYAVVGIAPQYELQGRGWRKIDTPAEVFKKVAGVLAWDANGSRGADILGPSGNRIGLWFSYYPSTTVKAGPGNKVFVYNPYRPDGLNPELSEEPP